MRTEEIANMKNLGVEELDSLKGDHSYNIISPKPSIEQVTEESAAVAGDRSAGHWLFPNASQDELKMIWWAFAVALSLFLLFILASQKRLAKTIDHGKDNCYCRMVANHHFFNHLDCPHSWF